MKINYDLKLKELISNLTEKKKLLLHSCCGPCSSYVLDYLSNYFDITILYYNPNIYPENEYDKRLNEQIKLINLLNNKSIKLLTVPYNEEEFLNEIKGFETEEEGKQRCHLCYKFRLEKTANYAKENTYDFFATTLSVSPYKNSTVLNEIGIELEKKYNVPYLYSDFKKNDGYKKSIELSKKYDLYRQEYCGCRFSLEKFTNH
jgi:Uncharacterized protein conserved in bacteria